MDPYLRGAAICGVILLVVGLLLGVNYFTNNQQNNSDVEQGEPKNEQAQTVSQNPTYHPIVKPASPPLIGYKINSRPMMPLVLLPPFNPDSEELEKYNQQKAEYDEALRKYNEAMEKYVSLVVTAQYGGMTLRTDDLELQIHKLINEERAKHDLDPLDYDYKISNIARSHSSDMSSQKYFEHEDQEGRGPAERGYEEGYSKCGDRETIQVMKEYDQLLRQFEATGSTDVAMYNRLEQMRNQTNSAINQGMVFDGLSENIFRSNLYERYWTTDDVITSYEWNTPEEIAKTTVQGWMNSTGHRQNILTPYYASEGIGVDVNFDSEVYVTQNFC